MAFAVELSFDPVADAAVRDLWRALDDAGVVSLGTEAERALRPHVSLAGCDGNGDDAELHDTLGPHLRAATGLELDLTSFGFFLARGIVAFLAVTPTTRLLEAHDAVVGALELHSVTPWPQYAVDAFVPHCTLAMDVGDPGRAASVLATHAHLPLAATVTEARLVSVPDGGRIFRV